MFKHYVILYVLLVTPSYFTQVIKQDECNVGQKSALPVSEETISVLKLLKEENHSEDPQHLMVNLALPRSSVKDESSAKFSSSESEEGESTVINGKGELQLINVQQVDEKANFGKDDSSFRHLSQQAGDFKDKVIPNSSSKSNEVKKNLDNVIKNGEESNNKKAPNLFRTQNEDLKSLSSDSINKKQSVNEKEISLINSKDSIVPSIILKEKVNIVSKGKDEKHFQITNKSVNKITDKDINIQETSKVNDQKINSVYLSSKSKNTIKPGNINHHIILHKNVNKENAKVVTTSSVKTTKSIKDAGPSGGISNNIDTVSTQDIERKREKRDVTKHFKENPPNAENNQEETSRLVTNSSSATSNNKGNVVKHPNIKTKDIVVPNTVLTNEISDKTVIREKIASEISYKPVLHLKEDVKKINSSVIGKRDAVQERKEIKRAEMPIEINNQRKNNVSQGQSINLPSPNSIPIHSGNINSNIQASTKVNKTVHHAQSKDDNLKIVNIVTTNPAAKIGIPSSNQRPERSVSDKILNTPQSLEGSDTPVKKTIQEAIHQKSQPISHTSIKAEVTSLNSNGRSQPPIIDQVSDMSTSQIHHSIVKKSGPQYSQTTLKSELHQTVTTDSATNSNLRLKRSTSNEDSKISEPPDNSATKSEIKVSIATPSSYTTSIPVSTSSEVSPAKNERNLKTITATGTPATSSDWKTKMNSEIQNLTKVLPDNVTSSSSNVKQTNISSVTNKQPEKYGPTVNVINVENNDVKDGRPTSSALHEENTSQKETTITDKISHEKEYRARKEKKSVQDDECDRNKSNKYKPLSESTDTSLIPEVKKTGNADITKEDTEVCEYNAKLSEEVTSQLKENETPVSNKNNLTKTEVPLDANNKKGDNRTFPKIEITAQPSSVQALQMERPSETFTQPSNIAKKIEEHITQTDEKATNDKNGILKTTESPDRSDKQIPTSNVSKSLHKSPVENVVEVNVTGKYVISERETSTQSENVMFKKNSHEDSRLPDAGNTSIILSSSEGFIPHPESQMQRNTDIKETIANSGSQNPRAEPLEQEFMDVNSDNFISSWRQRRGRASQVDESSTKSPSLNFPTIPEGESFRIHELGLSEGLFVFSYLGSFLSWMQPYDFPVELLRDALWNRLSIVSLITESLQVEMGFIACLCIAVLLALAAPLFLMIHACCSLVRRNSSSNNWEEDTACSSDNQGNCRRRTLVFLLQTILLLLVAGIVAMFVTNEQLSSAIHQTPNVVHTALSDVTTFLRNSNLQLHFVVTKSLDQAVETASNDLDNVETLLGRPIQRELEEATGVDVALDALVDATAAAQTLSKKVDALHEYCGETRGLALVAQERLADLRHQVDMLRRQCPAKDRALCETVEGSGLDVVLQLESLLNDQRLAGLRRLSQTNLSQVTQQAKGEFQFIPMHVEKETREARNGVRRQLLRQKALLDDAVWSLEAMTRDLGIRVDAARDQALQIVRGTSDLEQWRYLIGIGAALAVLLIWILLVAAVCCGCCGAEDKAGPTLLATVGVLCPLYLTLWALAIVALLVGGHGEVFVCRPLYDEPGYGALTKLVDKPGVLFQRGGGFFSSILYGNDSLNVPLKDVLMACQKNEPSYPSFKLHQVFDVDSASDHGSWESLHRQLAKLEVNLTGLQLLTPDLQTQLQELLNAATVNLTTHRIQLSGPVTSKDLLSFSDQLESVANQITDLATASRMETLATRTRRLLASHIGPLKQRKEDMVYQLTALEVQLVPLQRQVNQSLSHLKTIQFFINNQGANISHIKSQEYITRIVGYLQQYRDHVLHATSSYVAPCRPIWDLFHAMRVLFCRHVMDPLNGFWFATVWCLLLLLTSIPLCVKLASCYRQSRPGSLLPRSHTESPPETGSIPDPPEPARPWGTPGDGDNIWK